MTELNETRQMTEADLLAESQILSLSQESLEVLTAIRTGRVDALVVLGPDGERVFTLKGAEEPYRAMVEAMTEGAATYSRDGVILYCNKRFAEMVGMPLEQLQGSLLKQLVVPEMLEQFEADLAQSLENPVRGITKFQASGPTVLSIQFSTRPLMSNKLEGVAAVFTDISEVTAARDAALEASNLKTNFLNNISHELRTPLHGILGMNELLLHSTLTEGQRKKANAVEFSARALLALVNDILDFRQIEQGEMIIENVPFDPCQMIDRALQVIAPAAANKNLRLLKTVETGIPCPLLGDSGRLYQVLLNLLGNAVKFTEQGEINLRVNIESQDADRLRLKFSVSDTGIGIEEGKEHLLFAPFSQVDGSLSRRFSGVGLGLTICSRLVELMGGEIDFFSEKGRGSTFWVIVPLRRPSEQAAD
jgi:two-component system, sensor histidine kinase and response regulator